MNNIAELMKAKRALSKDKRMCSYLERKFNNRIKIVYNDDSTIVIHDLSEEPIKLMEINLTPSRQFGKIYCTNQHKQYVKGHFNSLKMVKELYSDCWFANLEQIAQIDFSIFLTQVQ